MKKKLQIIGLLLALTAAACTGCKAPQLEPGGAYNPLPTTNADGTVAASAPAPALFIADSGYKLAYDAVDAVLTFERDNRAQLAAISPKIKTTIDGLRPKIVDVDRRWAAARQAYKANPIPANLTTLQQILAEIQALVPVVQAALPPPAATTVSTNAL